MSACKLEGSVAKDLDTARQNGSFLDGISAFNHGSNGGQKIRRVMGPKQQAVLPNGCETGLIQDLSDIVT